MLTKEDIKRAVRESFDMLKIKVSCECKDFLALGELTEFQGGLKSRTEFDVDKIVRSIRKYGIAFPLFVWRHDGVNHCLDGHGRLLALKKMREDGDTIPPLPVVYVDLKDERSARDLLLRLNSQYGRMTADSVREFAEGFDVDFTEFQLPCGVIDFDVADVQETEGDDDVPEEQEDVVSQRGEMYELGNSILMCGDSTNEEDVARLMGGGKADLALTDPPYNVAYEGKTKDRLKIQNDKMGDEPFLNFLRDAFSAMFGALKAGGAFYIWHADLEGLNFRLAVKETGGQVRECLIWNKNSMVFGRQDYQWKHEPCLYGWKDGGGHGWYGGRAQTTVLDCKKPNRNAEHPTMKPVELFERLILNSTKAEDIVLDLFGGSGTTLIACEKNNRKARLMELDPKYCDVIRRRYTKWARENNRPITSGCLE